MADPGPVIHSPSEWMAWIWGVIMGAVAAIAGMLGWVTPKFRGVNRKLEAVEQQISDNDECAHRELDKEAKEIRQEVQRRTDELNSRITSTATLVAALQENITQTRKIYEELVKTLNALRHESREQLQDLAQLKGRMGIKSEH